MIWFVSRHAGAAQWAAAQGLQWDRLVGHLDLSRVADGDRVYGTLPAHLVAQLCARGVQYWHLATDCPAEMRGLELAAPTMRSCGAHFVRLHVAEVLA